MAAAGLLIGPALAQPRPALRPVTAAIELPAPPEPDALARTVAALEAWLDIHAPWPARRTLPRIIVVSDADMRLIGGPPGRGQRRRLGLYDEDSQTVFLTAPWSVENAFDRSVLLHELAHHRQAEAHWYCPAAQEPPAYRLQEAYLLDHDLALSVNWFAITWAAGCTPRDIHPD